MRTMDRAIDNGMRILLLTSGDSNYGQQSEEEIRLMAATVLGRAGDRAAVIVGTATPGGRSRSPTSAAMWSRWAPQR